MKFIRSNYFIPFLLSVVIYGCMVTSHSADYQKILDSKASQEELGKAKFMLGDMGGLRPYTLKSNSFVYKIVVIALALQDSNHRGTSAEALFSKYGFAFPQKIANWENAPSLKSGKPAGITFGRISGTYPTRGKYYFETANLACAACHGGLRYGADGNPSNELILGMPNTSINLNAFANDIYAGYKIMIRWDDKVFETEVLKRYPAIPEEELRGLKILFPKLKKEIKKLMASLDRVSPYSIGGVGRTNGIAAIKRSLGLLDLTTYHKDEVAYVSIPSLAGRSFRSNLLVSGNYAGKGKDFFYAITAADTSIKHMQELAPVVAAFTIATMGFTPERSEEAIPDANDILSFVAKFQSPPFPGKIDVQRAEEGRKIFQKNCQSCHGKYEGTATSNQLVSFPNNFMPIAEIQTDSVRATCLKPGDTKAIKSTQLGKKMEVQVNKGYVTPILLGLWATAPYLHNGSVPTLWHLMHPKSRPAKFFCGGHQLDYDKMGIKGEMRDGIYQYMPGYVGFSEPEIFDTSKKGMSNSGHTEQFETLTEKEKSELLEFLKTL
jgi:mono/diheme cytochrome c family protein